MSETEALRKLAFALWEEMCAEEPGEVVVTDRVSVCTSNGLFLVTVGDDDHCTYWTADAAIDAVLKEMCK